MKSSVSDVSEHRDAALRRVKQLEAQKEPAGQSAPVAPPENSGQLEAEAEFYE